MYLIDQFYEYPVVHQINVELKNGFAMQNVPGGTGTGGNLIYFGTSY